MHMIGPDGIEHAAAASFDFTISVHLIIMALGVWALAHCIYRSFPRMIPSRVVLWAGLVYGCVLTPWIINLSAGAETPVMSLLGWTGTLLAGIIWVLSDPGEEPPLGPKAP